MPSSIEYLGRRVRLLHDYEIGNLGPNGMQIGNTRLVEAGTEGLVKSHKPKLTIVLDRNLGTISLSKDDVTLLPRS